MQLSDVHFKIGDSTYLDEKEKEQLLESYRRLFGEIYGFDIYDSLIKLANNNKRVYNKLKNFSESYFRAQQMLDELPEQTNISLLLIFNGNILIGAGRIRILDKDTISVPDIAIGFGTEEEKREIWKMAIEFIEEQSISENFKKMYVEVPLNSPCLLIRADDLGFREDPEDVVIDSDTRTYLLNKNLERTRNAK